MSERCPLGNGWYWDEGIPEFCREQCTKHWEAAISNGPDFIDSFSDEVNEVEFGGESLQRIRPERDKRGYATLHSFVFSGDDAFAEQYTFDCPHE